MDWNLPALGVSDLLVVLLSVGPVLVLGIPAVMKNVRQPPVLDVEEAPPAELSAATRRWHDALDKRFAALGYRPVGTFRVKNLPNQRVVLRGWSSADEAATAGACSLVDVRGNVVNGETWLELATSFQSGRGVSTATLRRSPIRRRLNSNEAHDAPGLRNDPAKLKARHDRNCAPHLARGPLRVPPAEFLARLQQNWEGDEADTRQIGFFRRLPDGNQAPTFRGAALLALDALSALSAESGPARLLAALVFGLGLPFAGFGLLADVAPQGLALGPPALGAAGFACGLLLGSRGLYWAPLLTWLGQRARVPGLRGSVLDRRERGGAPGARHRRLDRPREAAGEGLRNERRLEQARASPASPACSSDTAPSGRSRPSPRLSRVARATSVPWRGSTKAATSQKLLPRTLWSDGASPAGSTRTKKSSR